MTTPSVTLEKISLYLLTILLSLCTLLSVHPQWDIWLPGAQIALVGLLITLALLQASAAGQAPSFIWLLLLLTWAGASFFLPSTR